MEAIFETNSGFTSSPLGELNTRKIQHRVKFWIIALISGALLLLKPLYTQAKSIGGNAGSEVVVSYEGSCYWATNRSSRRVTVRLGPYSALLDPGEKFMFTGVGRGCFRSYVGAPDASYEVPLPKPAPARVRLPAPAKSTPVSPSGSVSPTLLERPHQVTRTQLTGLFGKIDGDLVI
jgi:hypothetical protein